ncbi:hypothetical protein Tsubulata_036117, partial [Turnera subulata]
MSNPEFLGGKSPKIMAGTFGAITWRVAGLPLLYNPQNPSLSPLSISISAKDPYCYRQNPRFLKMAQAEVQNNSPEIQEPSPKIPKLQQNGAHQVSQNPLPLLR